MNIDFVSYFIPKTLYRGTSEFNGDLKVVQMGDQVSVYSQGITQSVNYNCGLAQKGYWRKIVDVIKDEKPDLKSALIFGLAGGVTQHFISKEIGDVKIVSVEIDPEMVDISKKFFEVEEIPGHEIITADALDVLADPSKFLPVDTRFDVVVADTFVGLNFTGMGERIRYLEKVKSILNPDGLFVINYIFYKTDPLGPDLLQEEIKQVFGNVSSLQIKHPVLADNWVISAKNPIVGVVL